MTATAPESLDERWTALEAHRARLVQLGVRRLGSRPDAEDCASEARRFVHAIARLCVCSCVFFGTGLVSAEATAAASQAQRLGAVNQFDAGSAEVTTLVDIPRTATLAGTFCELPQEDRITGTGAVVLVTLIRVPYNTYDAIHDNAVFSFGRYTTPTGRRLAFDTACSADRTLIAGTYRVTVQHSAGTASVQLRLAGLSGDVVINNWFRSRGQLQVPAPLPPTNVTSPVAAEYATTGDLAEQGVIEDFAWIDLASLPQQVPGPTA
jgi:hypothetical protein